MNRKLLLLGIGMIILSSCAKEPDDIAPEDKTPAIVKLTDAEVERLPLLSDNHRRSPETVLAFAENYAKTVLPESKAVGNLSISDSILLVDAATKAKNLNIAPLYIISRGQDQGFILVAGDNRIAPVWGIIEQGCYTEGVNPNFDFMMERLQEEILLAVSRKESLRDSVYDNLRIKLGLDMTPGTKGDDGILPDPPGAPDLDVPENFDRMEVVERDMYYETEYQYGPLLKTKWGQRYPYDSEVIKHYPGCPVGCVATSMAQIMAYHKYPTYMASTGHTYLWGQFQPDRYNTWSSDARNSIGCLMLDLGKCLNMNYTIGVSNAYSTKIQGAFNSFGYTMQTAFGIAFRKYSYDPVFSDVKAGRPIQIIGDDGKTNGHAWVLDGVFQQNTFITYYALFYLGDKMIREIKGATAMKSSAHTVHHNFGWDGLNDGWFLSLDPAYFKPSGVDPNSFNKNLEIIIGIQPR